MRVLFSTTAGAGHFGPLIPVANACVAGGEAVAVAACEQFESAKREMIFVPLRSGRTLHHDVEGRWGAGRVLLRAAKAVVSEQV